MCKPVLGCPLGNKLQGWNLLPGASQKFSQKTDENRKKEDRTREKLHDDMVTQWSRESRTQPDHCVEMDKINLVLHHWSWTKHWAKSFSLTSISRKSCVCRNMSCHTQSWIERILKKTSRHKGQWAYQSPNGSHWQNLASFCWRCGVVAHNLMITMVLWTRQCFETSVIKPYPRYLSLFHRGLCMKWNWPVAFSAYVSWYYKINSNLSQSAYKQKHFILSFGIHKLFEMFA